MLPQVSQAKLLLIAREAISRDFSVDFPQVNRDDPALKEKGATFITLRHEGKMKGCQGVLEASRPLEDDVAHNAIRSLHDPRFTSLLAPELPKAVINISILSRCEPISVTTEEQALLDLRPGVDGIYLEFAGKLATFLPFVWKNYPDPKSFLTALRVKAGLDPEFWHPDLKLSRYTTESFSE